LLGFERSGQVQKFDMLGTHFFVVRVLLGVDEGAELSGQ
jgi:hypothetical protein